MTIAITTSSVPYCHIESKIKNKRAERRPTSNARHKGTHSSTSVSYFTKERENKLSPPIKTKISYTSLEKKKKGGDKPALLDPKGRKAAPAFLVKKEENIFPPPIKDKKNYSFL